MVPENFSVRLLDISAAGVLLQSNRPVESGTHGRLSLVLDGVPVRTSIHVERVVATEGPAAYRIGATFSALTPDHRQLIERFMTN
jgi:c-di-GMP-binding flagellar brake protein YcgR